MAKKKFRSAQKQLKAERLQRLASGQFVEDASAVAPMANVITRSAAEPTKESAGAKTVVPSAKVFAPKSFLATEIIRTVASLAVVIILLVAVIITGERTAILQQFGNWLVHAFRLA